MSCPDDETLIALVEDALPAIRIEAIEAHVDSCPSCRQVIASLASASTIAPKIAIGTTPSVPIGDQLARGTMIASRYRIDRAIGRGGMGAVYVARDITLDRDVAVKVHHAASGDERLYQEALAMARLAHPNVVNVFEVGFVDGRRFVAMEYVRGGTSREWLAQPRNWREIVTLFVEAGEGLVAAHRAGLVHRDFKPENVLVGSDGRPRVSDFGLVQTRGSSEGPLDPAAAAEPRPLHLRPDTPVVAGITETGTILGTPVYMAPEQLAGKSLDARCDQFSFCVAVWEALYGARPFAGATCAEILAAIEKHEVRRLDRDVPPRVREVLERGLAAKPDDRYPELPALLVDLRRAAAPSRTKRWIAISAISVLALGGGGALLGYSRGNRELLDRCEAPPPAWAPARRAAIEHAFLAVDLPYARDLLNGTLRALDAWATSWQNQQKTACIAFEVQHSDNAVLHARREACLDRARIEFAARVERLAEVDDKRITQIHRLVGSLPELAQCARTDVDTQPPDPAHRDKVAAYLTELARTSSLVYAGRYEEAAAQIDDVVRAAHETGNKRDEVEAGYIAGQLAMARGKSEDATKTFETALWTAEAAGDDMMVATLASDLMWAIGGRDERYDDAQKYRALAVAATERLGLPNRRANLLHTIGRVERAAAHYDAAEKAFKDALAILESEPSDPLRIATILADLGALASDRGRSAQAEPLERRAIEIYSKELGAEHPITIGTTGNLAGTLTDLGHFDEARAIYERTLAQFEKLEGPNGVNVAMTLNSLAGLDAVTGDDEHARVAYERALAIYEQHLDPNHPNTAQVLSNLAQVALHEKRNADAARYEQRALAMRRERLGPHHPEVVRSLLGLADISFATRDLAGALAWCNQAHDTLAGTDAAADQLGGQVAACQGEAELELGHTEKARTLLEAALAAAEGPDADPELRAQALFSLARALPSSARTHALELAHQARATAEKLGSMKDKSAEIDAWLHAHE